MTSAKTWGGRVLSGLAVAFLLFDAGGKLVSAAPVVEASTQLGVPVGALPVIGAVLLACTVLYAIPRTAILGAVLLTGYLGGAIATHVHAGGSAFEIAFPLLFAAIAWGGLALRDERVPRLWAARA